MVDNIIALASRDALWAAIQVGSPILGAMLVVGLIISVFQALTQINEATLAFIPKAVALAAVLLLAGPFMMGVLRAFAEGIFDQAVAIGGMR